VVFVIAMSAVVVLVMAVIVLAMIFVFAIVMAVIVVTVVLVRHVVPVIFVTAVVMRHVMPVNVMAVVFDPGVFLIPLMGAVRDFMPMVFMFPELMMFRIVADCIGMMIFVAIDPGTLPRCVIDENNAPVPGDAVITPAPGAE
jgi:hypothetical protein